ncbi:hypothetical protein O6H91_08G030500 [Diphasiastrum complanatum]|uniref:Uncharacterized protein n=1 Tax=Diphasiastrum complanatum TaxID=34168 RepID=A0ACC2CW31_DIPCM|nr:hypothetical protein O6H91_08G030500 [Diphasiastrum complanatum]
MERIAESTMSNTKLTKSIRLLIIASTVALILNIVLHRRNTDGIWKGPTSFFLNDQAMDDNKMHTDQSRSDFYLGRDILSAQIRGDSQSQYSNVAETGSRSRRGRKTRRLQKQTRQGSQSQTHSVRSSSKNKDNQSSKATHPSDQFRQPYATHAPPATARQKGENQKSAEISDESLFHVDYAPSGTRPPHSH